MKVKLRTIFAGPTGTGQPGDVIRVPEGLGRALIESGQAEALATVKKAAKAKRKAKAKGDAPETTSTAAPETTTQPAAGPRSRKPRQAKT
ncbi:MAG: hypothetical protein IIA59_00620 [Candidatus Marinimicrobia bacterium]|nr:hypothetical protein [Candidatus Neomarinimicrobiota bacterium]